MLFQILNTDSNFSIVSSKVGDPEEGRPWRYVLLQRSRREHYNLLVSQLGTTKLGIFTIEEISQKIRQLWKI